MVSWLSGASVMRQHERSFLSKELEAATAEPHVSARRGGRSDSSVRESESDQVAIIVVVHDIRLVESFTSGMRRAAES